MTPPLRFFAIAILLKLTSLAGAQESGPLLQFDKIVLDDVVFTGLVRTRRETALREIDLSSGKPLTSADIEIGLQRLRNTNLFRTVHGEIRDVDGRRQLHVHVEERWTTIPIAKFQSGGGVSQFTLGVYDPNLWGRLIEAGGQYENLSGSSSGVVWFRNPHLVDHQLALDTQFWSTARLRTKYDQVDANPTPINGFLHERERIYLGLTAKRHGRSSITGFYEYIDDHFSDRLVSDEVLALLAVKGLPPATTTDTVGATFKRGQLDSIGLHQRGQEASLSIRQTWVRSEKAPSFSQVDGQGVWHRPLFAATNLAARAMVGTTTTRLLQFWHYLGGLDRIRGFADNRFAGRHYWLLNFEVRHTLVDRSRWAAQAVVFSDSLSAAERFARLDTVTGSSMGLGVRIILPKYYRLALRFDFAQPIIRDDDMRFSFGFQQFF